MIYKPNVARENEAFASGANMAATRPGFTRGPEQEKPSMSMKASPFRALPKMSKVTGPSRKAR